MKWHTTARILPRSWERPKPLIGCMDYAKQEVLRTYFTTKQNTSPKMMALYADRFTSCCANPLSRRGDRLLFPFLVLEAKSDSSARSWHQIELQTALSIRTFLETQESLRAACGKDSKWQSGPLVWLITNRGGDWHVYAAYIEPVRARANTVGNHEYVS